MSASRPRALLALADGAVFYGASAGYLNRSGRACAVGEVVFNTSMTGYQEILTDPSYHRQIVALTAPQIGNTGATPLDCESSRVFASGLLVRAMSARPSSWRARNSLPEFLAENKTPALAEIDTRRLTRHLRTHGAQNGCLMAGPGATEKEALRRARAFDGLQGAKLAPEADGFAFGNDEEKSARAKGNWREGAWRDDDSFNNAEEAKGAPLIAVLDCGVKRSILRALTARGCRVQLLPYKTRAAGIAALKADGVLFSNGPGDPEPCGEMVTLAKQLATHNVPMLGICLGHQILALALGLQTEKMPFGHHGGNHPVKELQTGRVSITSQNHGFAVSARKAPDGVNITHLSLFDGSVQGFVAPRVPVLAFQGHPEAGPGPHDAENIFDEFAAMVKKARRKTSAVKKTLPSRRGRKN